jgi:virulence factor Mce-like protein
VTPRGDHVEEMLRIDPGVKVPAGAAAVIVSRSVATDRYVELTPVYDGGAELRDGAVLPIAKTRTPVEFDDLLASLEDISSTLAGPDGDAAPLTELLSVGATTLDGNGKRLGAALHDLAGVLDDVDQGSGDLAGTLDNLDILTTALARNDELVRRFSGEVTKATSMLDDQHEAIEATFDSLAAMVREVATFARTHRSQISDQLDDIATLSSSLLEHSSELEQLVSTMPLMMQNTDRAIDNQDRLVFKTRPGDLTPDQDEIALLCKTLPSAVCGSLDLDDFTLWELLGALGGVKKP